MQRPHPDRAAATLAQRERLLAQVSHRQDSSTEDWQMPGPAAGDARVDVHLLRHAADRAVREHDSAAARAWLEGLDTPDILEGTVQDGTARGLCARYEEAISLCPTPPSSDTDEDPDTKAQVFTDKELRRKRDILVASGGARIRFSRRRGILLVDRQRDIHEEDCIQFEDRSDAGCLDGFEPAPNERPRLFSPAFLKPASLRQGPVEDRLELLGRLGRGARGFPCRITLVGHKAETGIRMTVWIDNRHPDHRLRIRFRGLRDPAYITHRGTPGFTTVREKGRSFVAATLVRACGRLRVGERMIATPGAQLLQPIEHVFGLGVPV